MASSVLYTILLIVRRLRGAVLVDYMLECTVDTTVIVQYYSTCSTFLNVQYCSIVVIIIYNVRSQEIQSKVHRKLTDSAS